MHTHTHAQNNTHTPATQKCSQNEPFSTNTQIDTQNQHPLMHIHVQTH